ncbi:MAG: hypothetical protein PUE08_02990 [Eubacteriales bacterium]|nr:hypothetical protein [Eubacteriales bacterium]
MQRDKDKQNISSLNNFDIPAKKKKTPKTFEEKYQLEPEITNKYCAWVSNPTVQPDEKTEMGVPIPSTQNTEFSKEYQEENQR